MLVTQKCTPIIPANLYCTEKRKRTYKVQFLAHYALINRYAP